MKLGTDFTEFPQTVRKRRRGNGRLQRAKANPENSRIVLNDADYIQQGKGRSQVTAIGAEVNSGQHYFTESGSAQA